MTKDSTIYEKSKKNMKYFIFNLFHYVLSVFFSEGAIVVRINKTDLKYVKFTIYVTYLNKYSG